MTPSKEVPLGNRISLSKFSGTDEFLLLIPRDSNSPNILSVESIHSPTFDWESHIKMWLVMTLTEEVH